MHISQYQKHVGFETWIFSRLKLSEWPWIPWLPGWELLLHFWASKNLKLPHAALPKPRLVWSVWARSPLSALSMEDPWLDSKKFDAIGLPKLKLERIECHCFQGNCVLHSCPSCCLHCMGAFLAERCSESLIAKCCKMEPFVRKMTWAVHIMQLWGSNVFILFRKVSQHSWMQNANTVNRSSAFTIRYGKLWEVSSFWCHTIKHDWKCISSMATWQSWQHNLCTGVLMICHLRSTRLLKEHMLATKTVPPAWVL